MESQGERLKACRIKAGFATARAAAMAFNWNEGTYRGHESGNREISKKAAIEYSRAFGVSISWLLTGVEAAKGEGDDGETQRGEMLFRDAIGLRVVHILGWHSIEAMESKNEFTIAAVSTGQTAVVDKGVSSTAFAVRIRDEAMNNPNSLDTLRPGDLVVINPDAEPEPGKVVLACGKNDKEAVLRRLRIEVDEATGERKFILLPANPDFPRRTLASGEVKFLYRAFAHIRPMT